MQSDVWGFQKYGGPLFMKQKKRLRQCSQTCGAPKNPRVSKGPHFQPHPQLPRLIKRLIKPLDLGVGVDMLALTHITTDKAS